jgi:superfamily II DNA or RNA helicase
MLEQYIEILENVTSYYELYNKIKDYDKWEIDKIFILLTKYIFLLHQNFINITKNIYLYDEIPLKLKKTYNLSNKYDLLLETNDNEIYQIHNKFIFNKMEKFKIENYFDNSNFKYIYVTNVSDIYDEIMKFNNITCIFGDFFNKLDKDFFNNIRNKIKGKKIEYVTTKLLKYQENLIKKSIKYFDDHDKGIVNITNQNTKIESIIKLDKEIGTSLTLILVPSLCIINKYYQEIAKEYIDNSDVKIMIIYSYNEINDIENINGILSCDDKKIKYNLNNYINRYDKLIIICTYYSIDKLYTELNKKTIDLIIYDDVINIINQKIILNFYTSCYKNINSQLKISLTSQYFVLDNTTKKFGKEYFTYTLRKAIDDGLMCDYEILLIYIDKKQIDTYKLDNNIDINITEYYYLALGMIFNSLFDKKEISHLLTLHDDKKNSIASILSKIAEKNILIDKYNGNDSYKKRNDLINNLKDHDKTILIANNILNKDDDVDMSIIDSICFVDNISNYALNSIHILQNILKNYKGKNKIKIIIPIVDYDINYDNLITIVKSLNIYDEAVKEYFIALKYKNKINKKFPLRLEYYGYNDRNIDDFKKVCDNIKTVIMKYIYYWYIMIEKIENYANINNKLPKINNENKEITYMGIWFNQQKTDYKKFTNEMTDINKRKIWKEFINNYKNKKIINNIDKKDLIKNKNLPKIKNKNIENSFRIKNWLDNLNKIKVFININNRLPCYLDKKIYTWFVTQKLYYKKNIKNMKIPIIKKQWEEFIIENKNIENSFRMKKWLDNLNKIKVFININNRLPHNLDNNIYRWFIVQKLYYKKNIKMMKIHIIRKQWGEFIIEYNKYFIKNNDLKSKNNELKPKK